MMALEFLTKCTCPQLEDLREQAGVVSELEDTCQIYEESYKNGNKNFDNHYFKNAYNKSHIQLAEALDRYYKILLNNIERNNIAVRYSDGKKLSIFSLFFALATSAFLRKTEYYEFFCNRCNPQLPPPEDSKKLIKMLLPL